MSNLVKLLKQAGRPTEVTKLQEQADPIQSARNLRQSGQQLSQQRLPGLLDKPVQPDPNLEKTRQQELIRLLKSTERRDARHKAGFAERLEAASDLFKPKERDVVTSQEGFLTTPTGSKLIGLLKAQPDSVFSAQDLEALAGFNLIPLPSNYADLPDIEKKAVRLDRRQNLIAEKGRISRIAGDLLEDLQLEDKGLKERGTTLKTIQANLKQQQKTPFTLMGAVESGFDRLGRSIRGTLFENISPKRAMSILRPEIFGGEKLAKTREFDMKRIFEKRGFTGPSLSQVLPDMFVEDPETTANKRFLPFNAASIKSKFQIKPGGFFDVTPEGVLGFIGDMSTNPMYWIMAVPRASVGVALRIGKEISKQFPNLVSKIGQPLVYLNRKGASELFKIKQSISSDLLKKGTKATDRQLDDLATASLLSKYGTKLEKAPQFVEEGGLKIAVPGMLDTTVTLIKGQSIKNAANTISKHLAKLMPPELKPAVEGLKTTWAQLGSKISSTGRKLFGGEGSQIRNDLTKALYLEMMSAGVRRGKELNRHVLSTTLALAKKNGLGAEGAGEIIAAYYTSNMKQIAARTQIIKTEVGKILSRQPALGRKFGQKLNEAADLDETLGILDTIKKGNSTKFASALDDIVKEAEIKIHNQTHPLLPSDIKGIKPEELEGAKAYMQGLRNLTETNLQDFAALNPKYNYEGRLVDWFPALQLQKTLQGMMGIDERSGQAIALAINSMKRSGGLNAKTMHDKLKITLAQQNPKQTIKLVSDLHKGLLASEDAIKVGTLRQVFQAHLGDLFTNVPKTEKIPFQLVKGAKPAMVPQKIADQLLLELNKSTTMEKMFTSVWRTVGAEAATNIWKTTVTILWPMFHVRNAATELMNSFLDRGFAVFMNHGDAMKMQVPNVRKGMKIIAYDGTELSLADDLFSKLQSLEGIDNFKAEFIDDINDFLMFDSYRGAKLQNAITNNSLIRGAFTASQVTENHFRLTTFLHHYKKTKDFDIGLKAMNNWHVNYRQVLSPFERNFVKRVFPFYTFAKRNLMVQLRAISERPGMVAFPFDAMQAAGDELTEDELMAIPPWLMGRAFIKTGINKDGTSQLTMISGPPAEEAFGRFFTKDKEGNYSISDMAAKAIGGLLNPLIKFPVEHLMDRSFFFGGKIRGDGTEYVYDKVPSIFSTIISKLDQVQPESSKALRAILDVEGPKFNPKTGKEEFTMNPVILHMLQNLPISRFISAASRLADDDLTALQKAISQTTNVSFKNLDVGTAKNIGQKHSRGKLLDMLHRDRERVKARAIAAGIQPPERPDIRKQKRRLFPIKLRPLEND